MITFKQFLTESRSAPLYHATSKANAKQILEYDIINVGYVQPGIQKRTISLTRDFTFAKAWATMEHPSWGGGVIFEFDQQKLSSRYKIVPYNFWGALQTASKQPVEARQLPDTKFESRGKNYHFDNQFEEAVLQNIKHPLNYVTKIYVDDQIPSFLDRAKVPIYSYNTRKQLR